MALFFSTLSPKLIFQNIINKLVEHVDVIGFYLENDPDEIFIVTLNGYVSIANILKTRKQKKKLERINLKTDSCTQAENLMNKHKHVFGYQTI